MAHLYSTFYKYLCHLHKQMFCYCLQLRIAIFSGKSKLNYGIFIKILSCHHYLKFTAHSLMKILEYARRSEIGF